MAIWKPAIMLKLMQLIALSAIVLFAIASEAVEPSSPTRTDSVAATINELTSFLEKSDKEDKLTINILCGKSVKPTPGYIGSLQWYRKAANLGSAQAQYYLGGMYETGRRVLRDYTKAAQWYRQAANQGHIEAEVTLGYMYEIGRGVPQDYDRAIAWYRKAADTGYAIAQFNLGSMYENGHGVEKNDELAIQWYRKAANLGYADALNKLEEVEKPR
jgi:uncharacterized protein